MRNFSLIAVALSAAFLIAITGCGNGNLAPVSGTVTYDGKPVAKLRVVFQPEPIGDNYSVAPFSKGVTDKNGQFTLATRDKAPGAFIGKHKMAFQYSDISALAMSDLRNDMRDAKDMGDKEEFTKAQKKITELKAKLKGRPILVRYEGLTVDVPPGGLADFKIDLKELEKKK